jgi:hypothetical protein
MTPNPGVVSQKFTAVLKHRTRPPFSVERNTIYYWLRRSFKPDWLMIEYVQANGDDEAKQVASDLENYLDNNLLSAATPATSVDPICIQDSTT